MATMTARKKSAPKISAARKERINHFRQTHAIPFPGTLEKPYELSKMKKSNNARPTSFDILNNLPTVEEYLKDRRSAATFEGYHIVVQNRNYEKLPSADILPTIEESYCTNILLIDSETGFCFQPSDTDLPYHSLSHTARVFLRSGRVVTGKESLKNDEWFNDEGWYTDSIRNGLIIENQLLLNADEDDNGDVLVANESFKSYPCLSFSCLANLIAKKVVTAVNREDIIAGAKLNLIDFTVAETHPVSKAVRQNYGSARRFSKFSFHAWAATQKAPELGFSLINNDKLELEWHKSPTVVLRNGKESYIMGQDDGTYFGCVLTDNPSSLTEAFLSLMPEEARNRKGVIRQGEWFAIPVANQKSVPDIYSKDVILYANSYNGELSGLILPIEDRDSNRHYFDGGEVIITRNGFFARNFSIDHEEHPSLKGEPNIWYTFARNTALRSFSVEKVD